MQKQERCFTTWLNSLLSPMPATDVGADASLQAKRVAAQMKGLVWHLYTGNSEVAEIMLKIEQRVDAGLLRMKDEVCAFDGKTTALVPNGKESACSKSSHKKHPTNISQVKNNISFSTQGGDSCI
jgi:hypothetical protein